MSIKIQYRREKVKELMSLLQRAYERGDIRGVKQKTTRQNSQMRVLFDYAQSDYC